MTPEHTPSNDEGHEMGLKAELTKQSHHKIRLTACSGAFDHVTWVI